MKQHDKTVVPRNKDMNEYLVALGHQTHKDKRKKKLAYDKKKKDLYDYWPTKWQPDSTRLGSIPRFNWWTCTRKW